MADWESHRNLLKGLFLRDGKSLKEVMNHLAENHVFNASEAQYEAQFKKWKWKKNLKGSDWKYISKKLEERKKKDPEKESAVFLDGSMIPFEKVKKEISRHVHPNDQFKLQAMPESPKDVTVCTPPAESMVFRPCDAAIMKSVRRKRLNESSHQDLSIPKRQQTMTVATKATLRTVPTLDDVSTMDVVSAPRSPTRGLTQPSSNNQIRRGTISAVMNLHDLPFFQFQRIMKSRNGINQLEKMLPINDTLGENLVPNYWTQLPLPHYSTSPILSIGSDATILNSEMNDQSESLHAYLSISSSPLPLCKPLGVEILYPYEGLDTFEWIQKANEIVPAILANMPRSEGDDIQQGIELMLGPPTVESVRYFVEVGVYLASNNICRDATNNFITWMLRIVPWTALRLILSAELSTVQALAESVLTVATEIEDIEVVSDLLKNPRLAKLVRSSGKLLSEAVGTSNPELVRLFLHAGANPEMEWMGDLPLRCANKVGIARMLVEAGADVNPRTVFLGPPLVRAAHRSDVKLARYLISAGADVNVNSPGYPGALVSAARNGQRELLQLLLGAGADVNDNSPSSWNALQLAVESGNLDCVKLLVEAGANVNAPAHGTDEATVLQASSSRGYIEIVKFLLESGANVNAPGNRDVRFPRTVLTTAVEMNHLELVELLINAGADVNMPSFGYYGCNALEAAKSRPANSGIVNLLIAKGAHDATIVLGPHRKTQLREAVHRGDLSRVQLLMSIGVHIDMQLIECDYCDDDYDIALFSPVRRFSNRCTILHCALHCYPKALNVGLFRLLVEITDDVNAQNKARGVEPILQLAVESRNVEVVEILIDAGADVNEYNGEYDPANTPLMAAARTGNYEILRLLLSKGADINAIVKGQDATTALQASLRERKLDISYFLLANGAIINAPIAEEGYSELAYAAKLGNVQLVRDLLDHGAEVNAPAARTSGRTALQAAAELNPANMDMIQLLLEREADINAPAAEIYGRTALQAAVFSGHHQLVLHFLKAGADVNALDSPYDGISALKDAASGGHLDILHLLLKTGADKHLPVEKRYVDAASEARRWGHNVIAEILEGWDTGENVQDDREGVNHNSKEREKVVELY